MATHYSNQICRRFSHYEEKRLKETDPTLTINSKTVFYKFFCQFSCTDFTLAHITVPAIIQTSEVITDTLSVKQLRQIKTLYSQVEGSTL